MLIIVYANEFHSSTLPILSNTKQEGRNTSFQFGNTPCVLFAVLFENKVHIKLFKEGSKLYPDGFSLIQPNFIFLIYRPKITCKPMGNFAENLNLGKRVLNP